MRLPIGTMYNVIIPIGAQNMDTWGDQSGASQARGVISKAGFDAAMASAAASSPLQAPVMSAGPGAGTYGPTPYFSNQPSVPSAVTPATLPAVVSTFAPAQKAAHAMEVKRREVEAIKAGATPAQAAAQSAADMSQFYNVMSKATPQQLADFHAMSAKIEQNRSAADQAKHNAEVDRRVGVLVAGGMAPAAARVKAEADLQAIYAQLATVSAAQVADFEKLGEKVNVNRAAEAVAAQQQAGAAAAAEAARKLEADTAKNAARQVMMRNRIATPIRSGFWRK